MRTSVQAGMSLAQIGEFSFIIAGVGHTLGVVGDFLYPLAVGVSALTTLLTPWLIGASARAADFVDAHLPHRVQTYASLYESWVERLRSTAPHHDHRLVAHPARALAAGGGRHRPGRGDHRRLARHQDTCWRRPAKIGLVRDAVAAC